VTAAQGREQRDHPHSFRLRFLAWIKRATPTPTKVPLRNSVAQTNAYVSQSERSLHAKGIND